MTLIPPIGPASADLGDPACGLDTIDYTQIMIDLLPTGAAWPRGALTDGVGNLAPELVRDRLLAGLAASIHAVAERVCEVSLESNPLFTVELLPRWESALGLPDACTPSAASIEERRRAVIAKLLADGGQDRYYYIRLVWQVFGLRIDIIEHGEFRAAPSAADRPQIVPMVERYHARAEQRCWHERIQFVWEVVVLDPIGSGGLRFDESWFRASLSQSQDRLRHWGRGIALLLCLLRRLAPAHTLLVIGLTVPPPGTITVDQLWPIDGEQPLDLEIIAASPQP